MSPLRDSGTREALGFLSIGDDSAAGEGLAGLAARTMRLQCMIEDRHVQLMDNDGSVSIDPVVRVAAQLR